MTGRLAIFDHVGCKAGMDYYDTALAKGWRHGGGTVRIYSNFRSPDAEGVEFSEVYEGHSDRGSIIKMFRLLQGTFRASWDAVRSGTDAVIVHLFAADVVTTALVAIPRLFGLNVVVIAHDVSSFAGSDRKLFQSLIYNPLSRFIVVHNRFSRDMLLQHGVVKDPGKIRIVKHGGYLDYVGENLPTREEARRELGLDPEGRYILFFGQIKKVKGLDILLEAMTRMDDGTRLIIAGKPWKDRFDDYARIISEQGLTDRVVPIIRFIEDEERTLLFIAADVNVLPYRTIYQSGVLLMAMSHGLPVIASDLPANREVIEAGVNGLLFESERPEALAEQVNRFFEDSALQKRMGERAIETISREYDWNTIAGEYRQFIAQGRRDR